jgi:hypothetical protein
MGKCCTMQIAELQYTTFILAALVPVGLCCSRSDAAGDAVIGGAAAESDVLSMDDFQPTVVRKRAHAETLDDISTQQREVCEGNICSHTSLLGYV